MEAALIYDHSIELQQSSSVNIFERFPDFFAHQIFSFLFVHDIGKVFVATRMSLCEKMVMSQLQNIDFTTMTDPDGVTDITLSFLTLPGSKVQSLDRLSDMSLNSEMQVPLQVLAIKSRAVCNVQSLFTFISNRSSSKFLHTLVLRGCTGLFRSEDITDMTSSQQSTASTAFTAIAQHCPLLENLDLSRCGDPNWFLTPPAPLGQFSTSLQSGQTPLVAALISLILCSKRLKRLWLNDCYVINDSNIDLIIRACKKHHMIELLDLGFSSNNSLSSTSTLSPIHQAEMNRGVSSVAIEHIVSPLSQVNHPILLNNSREVPPSSLGSLVSLSLSGCGRMSCDALCGLSVLPLLSHLDLTGLAVDINVVQNIISSSSSIGCLFERLESLSLANTPISLPGIELLSEVSVKLESLCLHGCLNIAPPVEHKLLRQGLSLKVCKFLSELKHLNMSLTGFGFKQLNTIISKKTNSLSLSSRTKYQLEDEVAMSKLVKVNVRCCNGENWKALDYCYKLQYQEQMQILGKEVPIESKITLSDKIGDTNLEPCSHHFEWIDWANIPRVCNAVELSKWEGFVGLSADVACSVVMQLHPFTEVRFKSALPTWFDDTCGYLTSLIDVNNDASSGGGLNGPMSMPRRNKHVTFIVDVEGRVSGHIKHVRTRLKRQLEEHPSRKLLYLEKLTTQTIPKPESYFNMNHHPTASKIES